MSDKKRYTLTDLKAKIDYYNRKLVKTGIAQYFQLEEMYNARQVWLHDQDNYVRIESGTSKECIDAMEKRYHIIIDKHNEELKQLETRRKQIGYAYLSAEDLIELNTIIQESDTFVVQLEGSVFIVGDNRTCNSMLDALEKLLSKGAITQEQQDLFLLKLLGVS